MQKSRFAPVLTVGTQPRHIFPSRQTPAALHTFGLVSFVVVSGGVFLGETNCTMTPTLR